jgi:hypothetical protein
MHRNLVFLFIYLFYLFIFFIFFIYIFEFPVTLFCWNGKDENKETLETTKNDPRGRFGEQLSQT